MPGSSFIRSTTLTTRIFSFGMVSRRIVTAASVSSVGVSPQQAMTMSGSSPASLEAQSQMPTPWVQCLTACSIVSHCGRGSHRYGLHFAHREHIGCTVDYVAGRNRYMGYLISLGIYSFKGVKVGLDCANGSSWNIAKSVFDTRAMCITSATLSLQS